jgi:nucleotide-binding universal stress UspA family protein
MMAHRVPCECTDMKTILVPVEQSPHLPSILETACLLARSYGSYIEAFALRPAITAFMAVDPLSGTTLSGAEWDDDKSAGECREAFEIYMRQREIPLAGVGAGSEGPSFSFNAETPPGDSFVGSYGRVFDITVVGQPGPQALSPRMSTLEAALFESGRPILIAPRASPRKLGETIAIAWNGSTETARTIAFAMPLLARARRVVVVAVEGAGVPGPTTQQVCRYLEWNGITAEGRDLPAGKRPPGETLLAEVAAFGSDLLIKGAYTQSRLRQMIFGGVTSHILAEADLPVFMAH